MPTYEAPTLTSREVLDLILRLDSSANPGLTWEEFRKLVARCNGCGLVMTRRVFQSHTCVVVVEDNDVIDLTMEAD
jgi:hypothetical protein